MSRAKPQQPPAPGFVLGSKLDISGWRSGELIRDINGRVYCFLGYRRDKQPGNLPWYSPSVALHDHDGRGSYRFIVLQRGVITRSSFLKHDEYFKIIEDRYLCLPKGTSSYFGVICVGDRTEDEMLTRQVFGATMCEFEAVAYALAHVIGRSFHPAVQLPRLTFSKTRENSCDVSHCLIPQNFPYVAFEDSQYDWSHVSLFGLYRLLSFTCAPRSNLAAAMLASEEISTKLIRRLIENGLNTKPIYSQD